MVVANFLLSPEARAMKQSAEVWGDDTVLALSKLSASERRRFESLPQGVATLPPEAIGPTLPEPPPSWLTRIEDDWRGRHGRRQDERRRGNECVRPGRSRWTAL